MKKFHTTLILFFALIFAQAQIVNIPDTNFKNALVNTNCVDVDNDGTYDSDADTNDDGEIQVSEAEAVISLSVVSAGIQSLDGIQAFINLETLVCSYNSIDVLDLGGLTNLKTLNCSYNSMDVLGLNGLANLETLRCNTNSLDALNLDGLTNLTNLVCSGNQISTLDVTSLTNLVSISCNGNNLTELDVSTLTNLSTLNCGNNDLTILDVDNLSNLINLYCRYNQLTTLDVSSSPNLFKLECEYNQLESLNVSGLSNLNTIKCFYNQLTELDLTGLINLRFLLCNNNQITTLDLSEIIEEPLFLEGSNNQLSTLFAKNGKHNTLNFSDNPDIAFVCVDDSELNNVQLNVSNYGYTECAVSTYCSFVPGGEFYTLQGESKLDLNINGCDINDIVFPSLKFNVSDGINDGTFISDYSGSYNIPLPIGNHTVTPTLENPQYFNITPLSITVDFPTDADPFIQDFCLTSNGIFNDLEIYIVPINQARPGFDTAYKLVYKNKGNTNLSGNLSLQFNDDLMDLVYSSPIVDNSSANNLDWNYSNLEPFESREIDIIMNLNTPTDSNFPLNGDDVLVFEAIINPTSNDNTIDDNEFVLNQTVVNSYDPNDKRCLEGETITPEMVGEYVHYIVRFENTGTANAVNVVVKDEIDTSKFDINTLTPLHASHNFVTRIRNTNEVEFIFENINLPFDDANNDGFVVFKIITLDALVLGDTFTNDSEIYFDFNAPIITNDYITTVAEDNLSIDEFSSNSTVELFPNPVNDVLHISGETNLKSISISDINGRILQTISVVGSHKEMFIDLQNLSKGIYFVSVKSHKGEISEKIIKN